LCPAIASFTKSNFLSSFCAGFGANENDDGMTGVFGELIEGVVLPAYQPKVGTWVIHHRPYRQASELHRHPSAAASSFASVVASSFVGRPLPVFVLVTSPSFFSVLDSGKGYEYGSLADQMIEELEQLWPMPQHPQNS
jgi:hypothetical protein